MPGFLRTLLRLLGNLGRMVISLILAAVLVLIFFLVLPVMQHVSRPPAKDMELRQVGTANLPPPPPPPPEEEPEQEEQEEQPPELQEEAPPLDLSQLELALNPGFGGGGFGGGMDVNLFDSVGGKSDEESDAIFSMADLDQPPRVVYQPAPEYPPELHSKNLQGTVYIIFVIDKTGRVRNPIVQKSDHPAFERPALKAIKRWRFEPGKRKGKPVQFKMCVPITFMNS